MATPRTQEQVCIELPTNVNNGTGKNQNQPGREVDDEFDYSLRSQWLRAAVLGANDGLVSVSSIMMGIGAVKNDIKAMLLVGFAALVAGACSMAIGEFVSVYAQRDVEVSQMKREGGGGSDQKEKLPNPYQAALASALAFSVGAVIPLLSAVFVKDYKTRLVVVLVVAFLTLVVFGVVGAVVGKTPVVKSSVRVVVGGMMGIGVTFGLTKLIGNNGGLA